MPDSDRLPIPHDEHLTLLGKLVHNFSVLEMTVVLCITALIVADETVGRMVTAPLSFKRKLDVLGALVKHRFGGSHIEELAQEALTLASAAEDARNLVIHSAWASEEKGEGITTRLKFTVSRKRGFVEHSVSTSAEEIRESVRLTSTAIGAMQELLSAVGEGGDRSAKSV